MGINAPTLGAAIVGLAMAAGSGAAQERLSAVPAPLSQQAQALVSAAALEPAQAASRQRRRDPLWNGAAIGAAAGLAIGLIGAERCGNDFGCSGDTWQFALLGAAVGAGVGIGVDALFDRSGGGAAGAGANPRVRLLPLVAARRRGVRASVAF